MITIQTMAAAMISQISRPLYRTCMKYSTTNVAFTTAIVNATIVFSGPGKSKKATNTVNAVPTIKAKKMAT